MPRKRSNKRSTKQSIKRKNKRFTNRSNKRSIKRTKRIKYKGGGQKITSGSGGLATDDSERNRKPNKYSAVSEEDKNKTFPILCPVCQHDSFKRRHTYMNTSYLGGRGLLRRGKYILKSYHSVDRVLDKELTILDCVRCSNFLFFRREVKLSSEPVVEPVGEAVEAVDDESVGEAVEAVDDQDN